MKSKNATTTVHKFGATLKLLRKQAGMTLRSLGDLAGIPHSVIAAIESNSRTLNLQTAERLADALNVQNRSEFLMHAMSTTKNQRMLPFARRHSATVLNFLPLCLAHLAIDAAFIEESRYGEPPFETGRRADDFEEHVVATLQERVKHRRIRLSSADCPSLLLKLESGQILRVSISIEPGE